MHLPIDQNGLIPLQCWVQFIGILISLAPAETVALFHQAFYAHILTPFLYNRPFFLWATDVSIYFYCIFQPLLQFVYLPDSLLDYEKLVCNSQLTAHRTMTV